MNGHSAYSTSTLQPATYMYFPIQNFFIIADDQKFVKFDFSFLLPASFSVFMAL